VSPSDTLSLSPDPIHTSSDPIHVLSHPTVRLSQVYESYWTEYDDERLHTTDDYESECQSKMNDELSADQCTTYLARPRPSESETATSDSRGSTPIDSLSDFGHGHSRRSPP
jgi:hypothetical protein